ncbi:hypothetical protein [Bacillus sp. 03113]|uniref:hypothetical protein n=1 Tax=Bacillus sp. 03113 TaxID=2578211 RepID=UPI0011448000|nr:hypothetical protein [Bacillus sp. 03113]
MVSLTNGASQPRITEIVSESSTTSNQQIFHHNHLKKIIESHSEQNKQLKGSLIELNQTIQETKDVHEKTFDFVSLKMKEKEKETFLLLSNLSAAEKEILTLKEQIEKLVERNMNLLQMIKSYEQDQQIVFDQLSKHEHSLENNLQHMIELEHIDHDLSERIMKQNDINNEFSESLQSYEESKKSIQERIEKQEGITYKIIRELLNLKAFIYNVFGGYAEQKNNKNSHSLSTQKLMMKHDKNKKNSKLQ